MSSCINADLCVYLVIKTSVSNTLYKHVGIHPPHCSVHDDITSCPCSLQHYWKDCWRYLDLGHVCLVLLGQNSCALIRCVTGSLSNRTDGGIWGQFLSVAHLKSTLSYRFLWQSFARFFFPCGFLRPAVKHCKNVSSL